MRLAKAWWDGEGVGGKERAANEGSEERRATSEEGRRGARSEGTILSPDPLAESAIHFIYFQIQSRGYRPPASSEERLWFGVPCYELGSLMVISTAWYGLVLVSTSTCKLRTWKTLSGCSLFSSSYSGDRPPRLFSPLSLLACPLYKRSIVWRVMRALIHPPIYLSLQPSFFSPKVTRTSQLVH